MYLVYLLLEEKITMVYPNPPSSLVCNVHLRNQGKWKYLCLLEELNIQAAH